MTESEEILKELAAKAEELGNTMKAVSFRMKRTRKSLRYCRETCVSTNQMIGELNGQSE